MGILSLVVFFKKNIRTGLLNYLFFLSGSVVAVEYKQLDILSGLTTSKINTIFQDKVGYIWIGTDNGVNRYDGYKIYNYTYNLQDSRSFLGNSCNFITQDDEGNIWVGSELGVSQYDKQSDTFTQFPLYDLDNKVFYCDAYAFLKDTKGRNLILSNDYLYLFDEILEVSTSKRGFRTTEANSIPIKKGRGMIADKNGLLYIVTEGNGLVVFNSETKQIDFMIGNQLPTLFLKSIFIDREGRKWITTMNGGYFVVDEMDKLMPLVQYTPLDVNQNNDNKAIAHASNGDIWIANSSSLTKIDFKSKESEVFNFLTEKSPFQMVRCVFADRSGNVWIGTGTNGVLLFTPSDFAQNFNTISTTSNSFKLSNPSVLSILKLGDEKLLVGTDWGGLNVFDLRKKTRIVLTHSELNKSKTLPNDAVTALFQDSYGVIWVGTYQGGLSKLNLNGYDFQRVIPLTTEGNPLDVMHVTNIYEDKSLNLWVSTNGTGLFLFNRVTNTFKQYRNSSIPRGMEVSTNNILQVLQDDRQHYWIGTYYGLNRLNIEDGSFDYYIADNKVKRSISHNWILCMSFDLNGNLWLGTANGLNRYNRESNDFKAYFENNGLPSNTINAIVPDKMGYLWISTNKGISRFDPKTEKFDNFTKSDGLTGAEFIGRASFVDEHGEFFFGSTTGLNSFFPAQLSVVAQPLAVVFTSISALSTSPSILPYVDKDIDRTRKIELDHSHTNMVIEFSTLIYSKTDQIKYFYQMEGIDTSWVSLGNMHSVTFPKLPSGSYMFHVKALLSNSLSDAKVSSLKIIIRPPYFLSVWAWLFYVLIFMVILYLYQQFLRRNALIKSKLHITEHEKIKAEELYHEKLSFFSNISHELKTPLTIIIGYTEKLEKERCDDLNLIILKRNTNKLQRRIEQLLDFQKVDSGGMNLNLQYNDIVGYLRLIMHEFSYEATLHNIEYTFVTNKKRLSLRFDPEIIDKIITNLLSNAFKFTPDGGVISLYLKIEEESVEGVSKIKIAVEDNGVGILEEDLPFVFDRFFSKPGLSSHKGTGIGLALAYELAIKHDGQIMVERRSSGGTMFAFCFFVKSEEEMDIEVFPSFVEFIHKSSSHASLIAASLENTNEFDKLLTMLIVDDHADMRQYMGDIFEKEFNIIYATDGAMGLELAAKYQPDIIITDVMMPNIDGLEFCKRIKSSVALSHIPVVIVTAVFSESKKIEGLEFGADDYITKPFNSKFLELKVRNIMSRRERVAHYLKNAESISAEMLTSNLTDQLFMERLISLVEKNASDSDFGIQEIISKLGMSKSVFYRKVKSITNESVVDLIRAVRLKKAARLLVTTNLSVNEVAYQVGYSDAGYFIKVFKEYFETTPGEYKSR